MGALFGLSLLLGSIAGPAVPTAGYHQHRAQPDQACKSLVERLCRVASADMCKAIEREQARRPISPAEETQCRSVLDDPERLRKLLKQVRQP